jgi:hypothetical protein
MRHPDVDQTPNGLDDYGHDPRLTHMRPSSQSRSSTLELEYQTEMETYLRQVAERSGTRAIVENFAKYASRQALTRFLARDLIFRKVMGVHGSIIECGVYSGQGLLSWAQLSSIYEPVSGATREVFGFDTFEGFPSIDPADSDNASNISHQVGDLSVPDAYDDIKQAVQLFDKNRFMAQFPKVHVIKGDFLETADQFLRDYPHVIPALLYLDFDLYAPTKKALEVFSPRMPRGSIIAFDEANDPNWPGETRAIYECLDIRKIRLSKVPFDIKISYAVL